MSGAWRNREFVRASEHDAIPQLNLMTDGNMMLRKAIWLILIVCVAQGAYARDVIKGRDVYFDTEETEARDAVMGNPFSVLVLFLNMTPVLDSKGEPHDHNHLIQVIVDGGNGIQDPPKADGTPGGDDSLAWGNFNQVYIGGHTYPPEMVGKTGLFGTVKYFIPYTDDGVYYLRLWEGADAKKAPYYQDSSEYSSTIGDQGGGMLRVSSRIYKNPEDIDWKFGPSKPRTTK
ncbi:MAG: hypothetical protein H6506_01795 [Calditrichaeota bacterium]|nr:hypothetical protein [Calditrichota bacterium]MCB9391364.1 hypothetical protein [Calditrichota bacterium]